MKSIIKFSLLSILTICTVYAEAENVGAKDTIRKKIAGIGAQEVKPAEVVSNFNELFSKGKVSGQLEVMYSGYKEGSSNNPTKADPYSTVIGGQLMFETAHWKGFGGAIELTTVQEIGVLSGDNNNGERATLMVSASGDYTELSQAYLEYTKNGFTIRAGRQLIDTPLADSDDYRIVNNTFQAYIASYEMDNITLMAGYLEKWQGTDTGLVDENVAPADTDAWQDTGEDGTIFGGIDYDKGMLHLSTWYYDISQTDENTNSLGQNVANTSIYIDATIHAIKEDKLSIDVSAQYLQQNKEDNSDIEADIYGLMIELSIADLNIMVAYNNRSADDDKTSFSGFGGGTLFTNMDNMISDSIRGGDVDAYVLGASYKINKVTLGYAYGRFQRDATASLLKEDIIEHNIVAIYSATRNLTFFTIVTIDEDKENTGSSAINNSGDFTNFRVSASYNF